MRIDFASCDHNAKRFLESDAYSWLNKEAKDYVLANLSADLDKGFRVQDPMMYPSPQLMTTNPDMHKELLRLYVPRAA